ncbi:MAG: tyrosine-type recombinase/integrase [Actinomycetota bacterium]|nr:tyrosine-type recombinase/integrase [Actinomycetota bacterium]
MGRRRVEVEGAAHLVLVPGVSLLHPEEAVFAAMTAGWQAQQTARRLAASTIATRLRAVRRFASFTNDYPWKWSPSDVEEWTVSLVSARGGLAHSSLRAYQQALALFMDYLCDPRYGWASECERRFGTHPVQICHEWNTVAHIQGYEGRPTRRPLKRPELQALFDYADEQVAAVRRLGRKGWLAAFRDAVAIKTVYAWGLRRQEAVMLEAVDFTANAAAPEFGRYGVISVRYGKAARGSPPRRRNVLTVMGWAAEAVAEWVEEIRPLHAPGRSGPLWPTERGGRLRAADLAVRFADYRDAVGLPEALTLHCLRHSYVTHLVEDGFDPFFVQQQVGHVWGSTTALYTGVSSDYKNQVLRAALDRAFGDSSDDGKA